jgi:hypothetical protein
MGGQRPDVNVPGPVTSAGDEGLEQMPSESTARLARAFPRDGVTAESRRRWGDDRKATDREARHREGRRPPCGRRTVMIGFLWNASCDFGGWQVVESPQTSVMELVIELPG